MFVRLSDIPSVFVPSSPMLVASSPVLAFAVVADSANPPIPSATVFNSEPFALKSLIPSAVSLVLSRNEPRFSSATPVA